ncbi:unnamed protein product [Aphanomyces euteiches]|nr:hypothetical protein Ae201684P_002742 [Aphanomyces euteiches]
MADRWTSLDVFSGQAREVKTAIATHLDILSLIRLASTSTAWRSSLFQDDLRLWRFLCARDFGVSATSVFPPSTDWRSHYRKLFSPIVLTWEVIHGGRLRQEGNAWRNIATPARIQTQDLGRIKAVSCSRYGMHALTHRGSVWFWGRLDEQSSVMLGAQIPLNEACVAVSSGRNFGCAVSIHGKGYVWIHHDTQRFKVIQLTTSVMVRQIAAGWHHIAVL